PADQDGFSDVYLATEAGDAAPGPPQGLAANSVGSTVTLTWSRPLSGGAVSSYVVEAGSTSAATDLATIDTQNPLPVFVAAGVGAGTYFVRVRGANAAGVGPPSNEIIVIVR
ncbi:MAG TPA: fibronectin type III domain-containing protein, partial [Vicinamibacterales bacterium]|nr:fibronectin type III domain-containing protein [Vicinamibacterales bacterium]